MITKLSFQGYHRDDGAVGIRNHILIIPTVSCITFLAGKIAGKTNVKYLNNLYGCGQAGGDLKQTMNTLIGFGLNPNVGATLILSLGCEAADYREIYEEISSSGKPTELITVQQHGIRKTIENAISTINEFKRELKRQKREEAPISKLTVALECGGSDATSGIISNVVLGEITNTITRLGGTVIISETPEFIGAEKLFAKRAIDSTVKRQILETLHKFEEKLKAYGVDFLGTQPSPGNIEGGISTIEEKSLGAIRKSGTHRVQGVIDFAEKPSRPGLYLMNTPGYDVESVSGMVAGGAQIVLFTTGRGTPIGNPIAPVIKICANPEKVKVMKECIDIDLSNILSGKSTISEGARKILEKITEVSSGKTTRSEEMGFDDFGIYRIGPTY